MKFNIKSLRMILIIDIINKTMGILFEKEFRLLVLEKTLLNIPRLR